jgi:hypothetical protein
MDNLASPITKIDIAAPIWACGDVILSLARRVRMRELVAILQSRVLQRSPGDGGHSRGVAFHGSVKVWLRKFLFERAHGFGQASARTPVCPASPVSL